MTPRNLVISSVVAGLLLIVLVSVFLAGDDEPVSAPAEIATLPIKPAPVELPAPVPAPEVAEPEPEPVPEPPQPEVAVVEEPLPQVPAPPSLPSLNDSDRFVEQEIDNLANGDAVRRLITDAHIIRKFVVLVDGLSRGDIPARDLPVTRPVQSFSVNDLSDELYVLDPASYERFNLLVNTFTAINSQDVVANLDRLAPLLDDAYAELGYPGRTFRDTLLKAMDNVLAARMPSGEILLKRPSVNYRFADPLLEERSDLEKLLIRMGPDNAGKVQRKVRDIRSLLVN